MKTEPETAFVDAPPEGFAVWSTKTKHLVRHAVLEAGVSMSDVHLYGAYACVSKGNYTPDKKQLMAAFLELEDYEIAQVEGYINRVTEREANAEVETDTSGK